MVTQTLAHAARPRARPPAHPRARQSSGTCTSSPCALGVVDAVDNPARQTFVVRPRVAREHVERGRAQLRVVQRGAHDRPRRRRLPHRRWSARAGCSSSTPPRSSRCSSRSCCIRGDEAASAMPRAPGLRAASSPASATSRGGPTSWSSFVDRLPHRRVRHELPDLRLDDGGRVRPAAPTSTACSARSSRSAR